MLLPILRTAALAGTLGLLAGCVEPPPPMPVAMVPSPGDPCARDVAEFNAVAGYFSEPEPRPASRGTLEVELQSESNALERMQIAFGTLVQCRWAEGKAAPSAALRLRQEAEQAAMIRNVAEARGRRLDAAVDRTVPGARATIAAGAVAPSPDAVTGTTVDLRLRPDMTSPIVARLPPGTRARLQQEGAGGFVLADAGPQARGYAPGGAFIMVPEVQVAGGYARSRLVSLAATGAARRAAFGRAIALAEQPPPY